MMVESGFRICSLFFVLCYIALRSVDEVGQPRGPWERRITSLASFQSGGRHTYHGRRHCPSRGAASPRNPIVPWRIGELANWRSSSRPTLEHRSTFPRHADPFGPTVFLIFMHVCQFINRSTAMITRLPRPTEWIYLGHHCHPTLAPIYISNPINRTVQHDCKNYPRDFLFLDFVGFFILVHAGHELER